MTQCQAAVQGFGPQETKRSSAERERRNARWRVRAGQWGLLVAVFVFWWLMTKPGLVPPFFFENDSQAGLFFKPLPDLSAHLGVVCGRRNLSAPLRDAL